PQEPSNSSTRSWKVIASDNILWCKLFKERWGEAHASLYVPLDSRSWKDIYGMQHSCDRIVWGLKMIRKGGDYKGIIQRYLVSRNATNVSNGRAQSNLKRPYSGILGDILFFIGDSEVPSSSTKQNPVL
ncbi:hypothetical protein IFM89_001814, partial [Coptis chinensis]